MVSGMNGFIGRCFTLRTAASSVDARTLTTRLFGRILARVGRVEVVMTTALRNTGIEPVGEMPWGTHFSHFYETAEDLLETLVPFFKAGLESNEFCAWVVSEPLTEGGVWQALERALPRFNRYVSERSIEVLNAREVYLAGGEIGRASCRER